MVKRLEHERSAITLLQIFYFINCLEENEQMRLNGTVPEECSI